jgi:hypothetical protein
MSDDHDSGAAATVDEADPDEETVEAERARREARENESPEATGEAQERVAEAQKQENPDNHRDEAPHES